MADQQERAGVGVVADDEEGGAAGGRHRRGLEVVREKWARKVKTASRSRLAARMPSLGHPRREVPEPPTSRRTATYEEVHGHSQVKLVATPDHLTHREDLALTTQLAKGLHYPLFEELLV